MAPLVSMTEREIHYELPTLPDYGTWGSRLSALLDDEGATSLMNYKQYELRSVGRRTTLAPRTVLYLLGDASGEHFTVSLTTIKSLIKGFDRLQPTITGITRNVSIHFGKFYEV